MLDILDVETKSIKVDLELHREIYDTSIVIPIVLSIVNNNWSFWILFWSIFLPCGVRYSLDSMLQATSNIDSHNYSNSNTVTSLAALAILIQMSMLYIFPAVFKTVAAWR